MSKKKILSVDDSRTVRRLISNYLAPFSCDVIEAENGQEGVQKAIAEKPDLIILDVTMPVMDGHEALKHIRATPATKEIPVIMLTAESRKAMVIDFLKRGISGYIVKPFLQDDFVKKVTDVLPLSMDVGEEEVVTRPANAPPLVLVLDDKQPVLTNAERLLKGVCDVITTLNGNEAVELVHKHRPDVAILDLVVPEGSTIDLFKQMIADGKAGDCRFVALGIRTMNDELQNAYRAGFHDTLTKPFDRAAISQAVRRNLPNQELMTEVAEGILRLNLGPFLGAAGSGRTFVGPQQKMVLTAISDAADEGHAHIVLDLLETSDSTENRIIGAAVNRIRRHAEELGIRISLVCDPTQQHRGLFVGGNEALAEDVFRSVDEVVGRFAPDSFEDQFAVA